MRPSQTVTAAAPLLDFLFATWPEVKRTQMKQWLKHQAVSVNGRAITRFDHPLAIGDVVAVRTGKLAAPKAELPTGLKILFEDADVVVVDKPAGLLSMATDAETDRTVEALLTRHLRRGHDRRAATIFPAYRLDRETSGLMVLARTAAAHSRLLDGPNALEIRFEAVCHGHLESDHGTFDSHLDESLPFMVRSFARPGPETHHAITRFRVIDRSQRLSLVELTVNALRRHQVRVHLADAGHPVIGDTKYGSGPPSSRRLGLHAVAVRFHHPATGRPFELLSPLPRELAKLVPASGTAAGMPSHLGSARESATPTRRPTRRPAGKQASRPSPPTQASRPRRGPRDT